jgi:hypothetical protein
LFIVWSAAKNFSSSSFSGYLGGAIASYVRIGEPYPVLVPLSTCLLLWAGIYGVVNNARISSVYSM